MSVLRGTFRLSLVVALLVLLGSASYAAAVSHLTASEAAFVLVLLPAGAFLFVNLLGLVFLGTWSVARWISAGYR
jgi:hypothetical protein